MNLNRLSLVLVAAFVASAIVSWFCLQFSEVAAHRQGHVAAALLTAPQRLAYAPPNTGMSGTSGDYLSAIAAEGAYVWAPNRMPVTVYIGDGTGTRGYQPQMQSLIVKAFDEWCRASNGRLSWRRVNSARQAAVVVGWMDRSKAMGAGFEAGETRTTTVTTRYGGTSIESADISILTNMMGRPFAQSELYKTCLHEVGHALGLQGHSRTPGDIMYPSLNPRQVPYLTQRDANTIQRLYRNYREDSPTIAQASPQGLDLPPGAGSSDDGIQPFTDDDSPSYGRDALADDGAEEEMPPPRPNRRSPYWGNRQPMSAPMMPPPQIGNPQYGNPQYGSPQSGFIKQFAWQMGQQMLRQAVGRYGL